MRIVRAAALAAALVAPVVAHPAAADPGPAAVAYRAPVPGPVIDPYRPPSTPYGPGNLGIDYATTPGEPVGAAADGAVVFAGAVGGSLHVVVLHADGIRTSLSFLAGLLVRRGQQVAGGQPVGWAAASVHFGARRGEAYLDPATLLAGATSGRAVLVPEGPGRPLGAGEEAAGLGLLLRGDAPVPSPAPATAVSALPPSGEPARSAGPLRRVADAVPPVVAVAPLATACVLAGRSRRRRRAQDPVAAGDGGGYPVGSAGFHRAASTHRFIPTPAPGTPRSRPSRRAPPERSTNRGSSQAWPSSP